MGELRAVDAPVTEWTDAIPSRKSRRSFDGSPLDPETLDAIEETAASFRPSPVARVLVVRKAPPDIFSGIVGGYGRISGAPSALVFCGTVGAPGVDAAVGYTGEGVVLEATRRGVETCWVGGTFKQQKVAQYVELGGGERILAVSPLGSAKESVTGTERLVYGMRDAPKPRKPAEELAPGYADLPEWARHGIDAARLAPSAMNRQPWRFRYEEGRVVIAFDGEDTPVISKRLDCGIAMLHFELAVRADGLTGVWQRTDHGKDVATFRLE